MFKKFMFGRNGVDGLFIFSFVVYLVLWGLNFIFISPWLYYIALLILFLSLFRLLSRNLPKRQAENAKFIEIFSKIYPNAETYKARLLQGRDYSFYECPKCGATLRFKRRKGKFNITCPKCNNTVTIKKWM